MKNIVKILLAFAVIITFGLACNKTSELGADLFEGEKFNYQYADTIAITASSEPSQPLVGYAAGFAPDDILLVGKMEDNIFGITETRAYAQLSPEGNANIPNALVDSVVFRLFYNTTGTYGDTNQVQKIGLYRLTQELTTTSTITTNTTFPTESSPLGTAEFKPTPNSTFKALARIDSAGKTVDSLVDFKARVTFNIDKKFGEQILNLDTSNYNDLSKFRSWFKGIEVRAEKTTNTTTAFSFRTTDSTGLYIYYRTSTTDTVQKTIRLVPTANLFRYTYFGHDISKSVVKNFINNSAKSDSLLFVQSGAGVITKLEFSNIKNLSNIIVNKAILEFPVYPDTANNYSPIDRILLYRPNFTVINDADTEGQFDQYFGGYLDKTKTPWVYRMNVSAHLHKVITGKESSYIYMLAQLQQQKVSRSILYGPKNPTHRAKLLLYYTKVNL